MASFAVLAAVLAVIAALVMFLSGELTSGSQQDSSSDTLNAEREHCCRQAGQGALCVATFQVSHKQGV